MAKPDYLFEVSSEAGRKVGGIYTVLRSKTKYMIEEYGKSYFLIGMLDEKCAGEVEDIKPPKGIKEVMEELKKDGIKVRFVKWLYGSGAQIILVDARKFGSHMVKYYDGGDKRDSQTNYAKFLLWKNFGIDSLMESSWDFSINVTWSYAVGILLSRLTTKKMFKNKKIVAHFHEWISGAGLLYCKMNKLPVKTVFTTHATVLGRALASSGKDVLQEAMEKKEQINISVAYRYKVQGKHQLEAETAKNADIFTTVSDTVADEVKYILGKKPDIILVNGMDFETFESKAKIKTKSSYFRNEMLQFIESLFAPYYADRYDNAMIIFTSGRYEYINKGFDIYLEALGQLNKRLKQKGKANDKRIFAFVFAPSSVSGPRTPIIRNYLALDKITELLAQAGIDHREYKNVFEAIEKSGHLKHHLTAITKNFVKEDGKPTISCYGLNYRNDKVLKECNTLGLKNRKDDVVKVIFYPTYLGPNDGLLELPYYDVISGCDVGIFPSRYEPFGYTPVEAGVNMNVSITSDATGFGRYALKKLNLKGRGLKVIKMCGVEKEKSVKELADYLEKIYNMNNKKFSELRKDAYNVVKICDWKTLSKNYFKAHKKALGAGR